MPVGPGTPPGEESQHTRDELVERLDALAPDDALEILTSFASALFPSGSADLSQVTWKPTTTPVSIPPGAAPPDPTDAAAEEEARLRTAELRYRTLVEQIPAITFMAVLGEGENEIYVSPYIEKLLGFTQEEWLADPLLWYSQLHPDDRAMWIEEFARGCGTGGPFRAECRLIAKDGHTVWVRGEARLIQDDLGRPMFLQGVVFDITESKKAQEAVLREAVTRTQRRYRDLVQQLDAVFWEADADSGRFSFVSRGAEQILGFPPEEWIDDPDFWISRVHPEDRDEVSRKWKGALARATDREFEFRAITADDRIVWLHNHIRFPEVDPTGSYPMGVMLDITERKGWEEELARSLDEARRARGEAESASRAKDEFLATLSHELRTPINALLGWAHLLETRIVDGEGAERAIKAITRNAHMQAQIVEDLLDVSRIVTGNLRLEMERVDLVHVIEEAFDTVELAARAKRIHLSTELSASKTYVLGDPDRLRQVLSNLLTNAVKFTGDGGRVDVRLEVAHRRARIQVSDTGTGIDPAVLPRMFDRFRQADGSTTRAHGGLGLGLAIVRDLTELHGGTVRADSPGLGRGSTFTVELPLDTGDDEGKGAAPRGDRGSGARDADDG